MLRKCGPFINIITSNYCIIILLGHWIFANCIVWSLKSIFREFYFKLSDFRLVSKSFGDPPCTLIIKQIKQIVNKMVLTDVGKYCCEVGHFSGASDALKCRHWSFRNLFYKNRTFLKTPDNRSIRGGHPIFFSWFAIDGSITFFLLFDFDKSRFLGIWRITNSINRCFR
jgi:hypothetical protein